MISWNFVLCTRCVLKIHGNDPVLMLGLNDEQTVRALMTPADMRKEAKH